MERIRCVICGLLLALGLSCCPVPALASDGFLGGLEDLTGTREVEPKDYEERYQEEYRPTEVVLRSGEEIVSDSDATALDNIKDVVRRANTVDFFGANRPLIEAVEAFLGNGAWFRINLIVPAIGLVFMFWGLRKAVRMLFGAFRKGSASV